MIRRWWKQLRCPHPKGEVISELVEFGKYKDFWCQLCDKTWVK